MILIVAVAIGMWRSPWFRDAHPAPRLSIAVLPFANLSDDPKQQYFADAITEDVTTDLSGIGPILVISRSTVFKFKGKPVDNTQIGRELGVRYVLRGSVQFSADRVRVKVQLIDAGTDASLWVDRFDRSKGDLLALQDEITRQIIAALNVRLIGAEAARPTDHPDALDYVLRGLAAYRKWQILDNYAEAVGLFERALALSPRSAEAQRWLADVLSMRVIRRQTDVPAADIARAEELVGQALAASPRNAHAHLVKGQVLRAQNRCEAAIPEYEAAIAIYPNYGRAYGDLGWCKFLTGSIDEAIPSQEQAIRLGPGYPLNGNLYCRIGLLHLLQSHIPKAIGALEKARTDYPEMMEVRAYLAAAYALEGQTERAAAELAEARRLSGDNRYSSIAHLKVAQYWGVPKIRELFEATFFAGLGKAGMPEQ